MVLAAFLRRFQPVICQLKGTAPMGGAFDFVRMDAGQGLSRVGLTMRQDVAA
jgi:hypothetical protein